MYRLIKKNKEIDEVSKEIFWGHLRYYYNINSGMKRVFNERLYVGEIVETPLYKFANNKNTLEKKG